MKEVTFKLRPKIQVPLDGEWGEQDGVGEGTVWTSTEVKGEKFIMSVEGKFGWKAISIGKGSDHKGIVSHSFFVFCFFIFRTMNGKSLKIF